MYFISTLSMHNFHTCHSYLNDKILTGFDRGKITGMILIDMQKAFDTIDQGFSNSAISWYKQVFHSPFDNDYSAPGDLTRGVPQGSY